MRYSLQKRKRGLLCPLPSPWHRRSLTSLEKEKGQARLGERKGQEELIPTTQLCSEPLGVLRERLNGSQLRMWLDETNLHPGGCGHGKWRKEWLRCRRARLSAK
jgi:hypothetical protein